MATTKKPTGAAETNEIAAKESAAPKPGVERVKIRLFKDGHDYKDDVFVCVNGESYLIKRGEDVEVPSYIADILRLSEKQDTESANRREKRREEYESKR